MSYCPSMDWDRHCSDMDAGYDFLEAIATIFEASAPSFNAVDLLGEMGIVDNCVVYKDVIIQIDDNTDVLSVASKLLEREERKVLGSGDKVIIENPLYAYGPVGISIVDSVNSRMVMAKEDGVLHHCVRWDKVSRFVEDSNVPF